MTQFTLPDFDLDAFVRATLAEDLGAGGDITSMAVIPADARFGGVMDSRDAIIVAGLPIAEAFFRALDPAMEIEILVGEGAEVALVFGRERTGLTNEELQLCHAAVHIPSDPEFSSLNLAAAVQVLSYELRLAVLARAGEALASGRPMPPPEVEPPATADELEGYFRHLDQALHDIDFHKGKPPEMVMSRLRRLYLRAGLDAREVKILRGILAEAQRMARLARGGAA